MSLVLNTNASGGGAYALSNEFMGAYPDLQNSIALGLGCGKGYTKNTGINDGDYVASINGTKINGWVSSVVAPYCYMGLPMSSNTEGDYSICAFGCVNVETGTIVKRYGVNVPLKGGEVIGKRVSFQPPRGPFGCNNGQMFLMKKGNIVMTVELLHTDGTITNVATTTYSMDTTYQYLWNRLGNTGIPTESGYRGADLGIYAVSGDSIKTGSGVVASAGDLITIQLNLTIEATENGSGSYPTGYWRGFTYTNKDAVRAYPIQVSID